MKKNFFKKLSVVLALSMVVGSVPTNFASAATGVTLKNGSTTSTLKAGTSYTLKLGSSKAKWSSSNKKVATINATKGVLKAIKAGKVTITAKNAKTGKSYKKTYTICLRAKKVEAGADITLGVGATQTLKATLTPANSSDAVRYYSSDKSVATVGAISGKLTGLKAGTTTITVYSKATASTPNSNVLTLKDTLTVKVGEVIESATQATTTKLGVNFNSDMKAAKAGDFKIVSEDKTNKTVKAIAIEGKKVTVETFEKINDAKSYTVTYKGGTASESSYKFVATNGKVGSLGITPATVVVGVPTELKVQTKDANGVILDEYAYNNTSAEPKLDFTVTTTSGSVGGSKITFLTVGGTATAKATYHTYDYKDGKEVGALTADLTITAVDKSAATLKEIKYTVAKAKPTNWSTATLNDKLAINDDGYKVFLNLKDSNDEVLNQGYTLVSSDKDVLLVSNEGDMTATVKGVAQGSAYVLVKDVKGNVFTSVPVTVVEKRKAAGFALSAYNFELSSTAGNTQVVKVVLNDQYGVKMEDVLQNNITVNCVSAPSSAAKQDVINNPGNYFTKADGKVTFKGAGTVAGVYQYTISAGGFTQSVYVTMKLASATSTQECSFYAIGSDKEADLKFNPATGTYDELNFKVGAYVNGVLVGYVTPETAVVKKGNDVITEFQTPTAETVVAYASVNASTNVVTKNYSVGDYSIYFTVAPHTYNPTAVAPATKLTKVTGTNSTVKQDFTVKDTGSQLTATCVKDTVSESTIGAGVKSAFDFYYDGEKVDKSTLTIADGDVVATKSGNDYHVTKITITKSISDGKTTPTTYTVPFSAAVSKTITLN